MFIFNRNILYLVFFTSCDNASHQIVLHYIKLHCNIVTMLLLLLLCYVMLLPIVLHIEKVLPHLFAFNLFVFNEEIILPNITKQVNHNGDTSTNLLTQNK